VTFAVIIAVDMKITVLWDVKPHSVVGVYKNSEEYAASMIQKDK
jgi:hypothetical protein